MGEIRKLCKVWKKAGKEDLEMYKSLVSKHSHLCRECGRVGRIIQQICKPEPQ